MTFTIFCYGDGVFIDRIFNAVAAITNHGDFRYALMLVVSYTSLYVLLAAMLQGRIYDFKWFFSVLLIYSLLLMPRATVSIEDRFQGGGWGGPAQVHVVANIPMGLAFLASATSKLGDWLCLMMETVFSLPNGLRYEDNGPLFGSALVSAMNSFSITNANTAESLESFWHDCVFYDLVLGFYSLQDLVAASNLENFFSLHAASNRGFNYLNPQGQSKFLTCTQAFSGYLDVDLANEIAVAKPQITALAQNDLSSKLIQSGAVSMPLAFQYITGLSMSSSTALTQAALINSFAQGFYNFANPAQGNTGIYAYVQARAEQQRTLDYGVLGKISEKALPVIRDIFSAFLVSIFPIVALFSMAASGGMVIAVYARSMLWLALWPAIYAILNFGMTFFTSIAAQKALTLCSAGGCSLAYTLSNSYGLQSVLNLYTSISGYLMTSIPMIAWLMVQQSGAMLSQLAARVIQSYSQPVTAASADAGQGDFNQAQVHYDNVEAWSHASAPRNSSGFNWSDDGGFTTMHGSRGDVLSQSLSSTAVSINALESIEHSYSLSRQEMAASSRTSENKILHDRAQAWSQLQQISAELRESHETNHSESASHQQSAVLSDNSIDKVFSAFSKDHGFSHDEHKSLSVDLAAGLNFYSLGAKSSVAKTWSEVAFDKQDFIRQFMHSDQFSHALNVESSILQSKADMISAASSQKDIRQVGNLLQKSLHEESALSNIVQKQQRVDDQLAKIHRLQATSVHDFENAFIAELEDSGIDWRQGLQDLSLAKNTELSRHVQAIADQLIDTMARANRSD